MARPRDNIIARFNRYWVLDLNTGCWEWQGGKEKFGYGKFWHSDEGRSILAHRWSYEQHIGSIPEDLEIDHVCKKPSCVNPYHLEAVTHAENMARSALVGRRKIQCPQGHSEYVYRAGRGRRCRECHRLDEQQRQATQRFLRKIAR